MCCKAGQSEKKMCGGVKIIEVLPRYSSNKQCFAAGRAGDVKEGLWTDFTIRSVKDLSLA